MWRWILLVMPLLGTLSLFSQQLYRWMPASGAWQASENWFPERMFPHPGDTLVFSGDAVVVDGLPEMEEVHSIVITGGSHIEWRAARAARLNLFPNDGLALQVEADAVLSFSGDYGISCETGADGVTIISGEISFSEGPHRLTAASEAGIVFGEGGKFRAGTGFTGNPFGTMVLNSVIFEGGSTYISMAGANPFGAAAPNSVLVFENGSVYRHERATAPQLSGRTYGHFVVAAAASYNISLPSDWTVQNDLVVEEGQFLFRPSGGNGQFLLGGNIRQSGTGTLQIGQDAWPGFLVMNGSSEQSISADDPDAPCSIHRWKIAAAPGIRLERSVAVTGTLFLQNGNITTTPEALLILEDTAQIMHEANIYQEAAGVLSGHHDSFINGPVRRTGMRPDSSYHFPVGENGICRPVAVSKQSGSITVQYIYDDAGGVGYLPPAGMLRFISSSEHWNIIGLQEQARLSLSFLQPESGIIEDLNHLRVCAIQQGEWKILPALGTQGNPETDGWVAGNFNNGEIFTLGSIHPGSTLPAAPTIQWVKTEPYFIRILLENLESADETTIKAQTSIDGNHWISWNYSKIQLKSDIHSAQISGPLEPSGDNWFRFSLPGYPAEKYTPPVRVPVTPETAIKLYPNPAYEKIFIFFNPSSSKSIFEIVSITGTIVQTGAVTKDLIEIDVSHLTAGMYFLHLRNKNKHRILPFLKQ